MRGPVHVAKMSNFSLLPALNLLLKQLNDQEYIVVLVRYEKVPDAQSYAPICEIEKRGRCTERQRGQKMCIMTKNCLTKRALKKLSNIDTPREKDLKHIYEVLKNIRERVKYPCCSIQRTSGIKV